MSRGVCGCDLRSEPSWGCLGPWPFGFSSMQSPRGAPSSSWPELKRTGPTQNQLQCLECAATEHGTGKTDTSVFNGQLTALPASPGSASPDILHLLCLISPEIAPGGNQ